MEDFLVNLPDFGNADLRLFAAALHASSNGVVITDHNQPDEPIIYCNNAFENLTGYTKKEIIGHNCRFLQSEDRNQKSRNLLGAAIKNGEHCTVLLRNYKKDGRMVWNELMISPIKNPQGNVTHFIGIQNDVTKRVNAENELVEEREILDEQVRERTHNLEESESYLSAIVETIRESLIVLDSELRILSANENFCSFFRERYQDIIGEHLFKIGNGQWDIPELRQLLLNILPHNNPFEGFEMENEFASIGRKMLILNARQMTLKGKYQDRILLAIEDITERKAIEHRKEDFINIASHEMKTPLTSIKGNFQLLEKIAKRNNDTTYLKGFATAGKSIGRLERLIHDLLDVARMQSGKIQFNFEPFSLRKLIEDAVIVLEQSSPEHKISITGIDDITVEGDFGRLEQVMINLLSNAVKYSPIEKGINIHLSMLSGYCKVSVTDSGVGIHKRDHKRIFERFYRADEISERFPGVGVGLYVCSQIIKEHSGTLWVESEEEKGSVFSFTIPLKQK
ncbi:PAS domain-containing sensor histidine kinase [Pedobacter jejuensis]|uniref:histidine kinase n=1 Tax=Pedobacter jejuensis TaxID=1268550 RepID=A0A3N0BSM2_9SPHI|nr:HAMP domain-containing sensor histidine kinase [Pedobacter jejuensis]RNL52114.1 PAS domain S-box protein [Pedobacter jejuensis]